MCWCYFSKTSNTKEYVQEQTIFVFNTFKSGKRVPSSIMRRVGFVFKKQDCVQYPCLTFLF